MQQDNDQQPLTSFNSRFNAHYVRIMAYIVAAPTFAAGIYTELYSNEISWVVPLALFYPFFSHLATYYLRNRFPDATNLVLVMIDCFVCGCAIVIAKFNLTPTIVFLILANAGVMQIAGAKGWLTCMVTLAMGVGSGIYIFGNQVILDTPLLVTIVAGTGLTIFVAITSFFAYRQSKVLALAQLAIEQQQEISASLSRKLAKYLPPQVWGSLFSGKADAKLETQRKRLTVFFSDIKGFAEISEQLQPEALTELLNSYFTEMSRIALRHGGTIDKFVGDAIMVFFGDPSTKGSKDDALACVSMAIEMRNHMKVMRHKWRKHGITKPLHVRMGINTGYCTVGNFGAESRMDYTIIGKEVNLASRLESVAEPGEIVISDDTNNLVRDVVMCRDKGTINVKGFNKPVSIHEVVDFRKDLGSARSFVEYEYEGFTMYIDLAKIRNYDKDKILQNLSDSITRIKSRNIN